jgi:hypothetical protein
MMGFPAGSSLAGLPDRLLTHTFDRPGAARPAPRDDGRIDLWGVTTKYRSFTSQ